MFALRAPYVPDLVAHPAAPTDPEESSIIIKGFWFFLVAAVVGGLIVWVWKGPVAGAATAWFISPIPPPPLAPI